MVLAVLMPAIAVGKQHLLRHMEARVATRQVLLAPLVKMHTVPMPCTAKALQRHHRWDACMHSSACMTLLQFHRLKCVHGLSYLSCAVLLAHLAMY